MGNSTSFKPGFDPRRNLKGGRGGPKKYTIEQRREADEREKALQAQIDADKTTPLEFMLRTMKNPDLDRHERFQAAARAAPYMHPQLQAVAHKHMDAAGNPIAPVVTVTIEAVAEEVVEHPRLTRPTSSRFAKV